MSIAAIPSGFRGRAKLLDAFDLPRMARALNITEDWARAVVEVEAAGGGFDGRGRPKALFEPHRFWAELGEAKRAQAVRAGLAYRRWGEQPYPKESYTRIEAAMVIDRPAALRATSWGLGQIMGSNARICGYDSAEAMVAAFCDDEENHLQAVMNFIVANGLDDELRRGDVRGFAAGYNGRSYERHGYHTKLAAAHAKWARVPDVKL